MPNATIATEPAAATLEVRRTFAASRQRVFNAWTTAEALKQWHAPENAEVQNATVDFRVGGRYLIEMRGKDGNLHVVGGEYREIDPPKRLVITWAWQTGARASDSIVTVEFHERGAETEVVLLHEGLMTEEERAGHRHGWVGCFEKLATAV